ncbi:unnamed protein product [Vitrella brassicaformis CCMP3155]|uniref:Uncharacterized protein n=1 Tax=Vitrella brassicaformis (strain CCMP3155) TaxID=1169540 RepID=A0A0G4GSK2_VITBC|nr:unnamed protein product [Vitrella brassicaformis CCMP3155]|eukprot:CEM33639.1 unnamed protein product [Vitrella brassicaformis CCMP3155]
MSLAEIREDCHTVLHTYVCPFSLLVWDSTLLACSEAMFSSVLTCEAFTSPLQTMVLTLCVCANVYARNVPKLTRYAGFCIAM